MKNLKRHVISYNLLKALILATLIAVISTGIVYAGSAVNSKTVYTTILRNLANDMRNYAKLIPEEQAKSGILTYNETKKVINYPADEDLKETNFEMYFNGNKYFVKSSDFNLLILKDQNKVFAQKVEDGKASDEVLAYEDTDYDLYYEINSFVNKLNTGNSSLDSGMIMTKMLEAQAVSFEIYAKNLKDAYFIDRKANGLTEYVLSMNNEQIAEFLENVSNDLLNNEVYIDYLESMSLSLDEEDIKDELEEILKKVREMKNLKLEIVISAKGNIKNICGVKLEVVADDFKLLVDGKISDKDVAFDFECKYMQNTYDWSTFKQVNKEQNIKLSFAIKPKDNKALLKSSDLIGSLKLTADGEKKSIEVEVKGDSKKSFLDSKRIDVNVKMDDKDLSNIISIHSEDKKAFNKTSKIIMELKVEDQLLNLTLEAQDNKALLKSSYLNLSAGFDNKHIDLLTISSIRDSKPILESNNVDITMFVDDHKSTLNIQIYDNKGLKNILNSSNVTIEYKNDYEETSIFLHLKGNNSFDKATKFEISINGTIDEDPFDLIGGVESLDSKPIRESKNFKGNILYNYGGPDSYEKETHNLVFDTKKGYELESRIVYGIYSKTDTYQKAKLEYKDNIDVEKMMDISNAKDATYDEIMKVLDPTYEPFDFDAWYEDWLSKYDLEDDDDYDYDWDDDDYDWDDDWLYDDYELVD